MCFESPILSYMRERRSLSHGLHVFWISFDEGSLLPAILVLKRTAYHCPSRLQGTGGLAIHDSHIF